MTEKMNRQNLILLCCFMTLFSIKMNAQFVNDTNLSLTLSNDYFLESKKFVNYRKIREHFPITLNY